MTKGKGKEASVEEASLILEVTPRTVINYINSKEIEAIKVGKSWFINRASLEGFKQRYKLGNQTDPAKVRIRKMRKNRPIRKGNFRKIPKDSRKKVSQFIPSACSR